MSPTHHRHLCLLPFMLAFWFFSLIPPAPPPCWCVFASVHFPRLSVSWSAGYLVRVCCIFWYKWAFNFFSVAIKPHVFLKLCISSNFLLDFTASTRDQNVLRNSFYTATFSFLSLIPFQTQPALWGFTRLSCTFLPYFEKFWNTQNVGCIEKKDKPQESPKLDAEVALVWNW